MDMQCASTRSLNSFRTLSIGSCLSAVAVHSYASSYALNLPPVLSGSSLAVVLASRSSSARLVSQLPLPKMALDESRAIHSWRTLPPKPPRPNPRGERSKARGPFPPHPPPHQL